VVRSVCRDWERKLGLTLTAGADKTATTAPTRSNAGDEFSGKL